MADVEGFVEATFGATYKEQLRYISQGGNNNFKGSEYESMLACIKICQFAADINNVYLDKLLITSQATAFVDDLAIINDNNKEKLNYQAKNSNGQAAKWTGTLHERFRMQKQIDASLHGYTKNKQILVVSSADKHVENEVVIKGIGDASFASEYVPYEQNIISLIRDFPPLREALITLATDANMATIEYVYKVVLGAWVASNKSSWQSIGDILGVAKASGKPSYFKREIQARDVPDWLKSLCGSVQGCVVGLELGNVYAYILELKLNLGAAPKINSEVEQLLAKVDRSATDVASVLMRLTSKSY